MWLQWILTIAICVWVLAIIMKIILPPASETDRVVRLDKRKKCLQEELYYLTKRKVEGDTSIKEGRLDSLGEASVLLQCDISRRIKCSLRR